MLPKLRRNSSFALLVGDLVFQRNSSRPKTKDLGIQAIESTRVTQNVSFLTALELSLYIQLHAMQARRYGLYKALTR